MFGLGFWRGGVYVVLLACWILSCAQARCGVGFKVLAFDIRRGLWQEGRVLRRPPGDAALVQLRGTTGNISVSPGALRTAHGQPCFSAVLCLFGRVGNLEGKFDEFGSSHEALALAAPTIKMHVLSANPEFSWDVVAHTWDTAFVEDIKQAFHPLEIEADEQPKLDNVYSFAESVRRSAILKSRVEKRGGFVYDLAVLMRYDIFFRRPLRLAHICCPIDRLWTGHWCSVHAEDLSVREVILSHEPDVSDVRQRSGGVLAPSQFAPFGLHDFWFAGTSSIIDRFAQWGDSIDSFRTTRGANALPVHCGHFYTYLHAQTLGVALGYTGVSYLDYTLARYHNCNFSAAEVVMDPDRFCSHWEISIPRQCEEWLPMPAGWSVGFCPLAGRRAILAPGAGNCGRF